MKREHPEVISSHPFEYIVPFLTVAPSLTLLKRSIKVKDVNLSYHLEKVFNVDIPRLQHGNDGLIYTPVATPYVPGTDKNMYAYLRLLPPTRSPCKLINANIMAPQTKMEATLGELN